MKFIVLILLSFSNLFLFSQDFTEVFLEDKHKTILVGEITTENLQQVPYTEWYRSEYQVYEVNNDIVAELNKKPLEDLSVTIFMGTWCHDSHEQVPRFMKIIETLDYKISLKIYALDTRKECPNIDSHLFNIELVPTFIIYKNKLELGRIIETPTSSLEGDLLKIIEKI